MGAITCQDFWGVSIPWIDVFPEIEFEYRYPGKKTLDKCILAHEV